MKIRLLLVLCCLLLASCVLPTKSNELRAPYWENGLAIRNNFIPIEEGAIYSSAEPDLELIRWIMDEKGVRTFVSLKGEFSQKNAALIHEKGGTMKSFSWSAKKVPPEKEIDEALAILNHREGGAVHIFCRAGADRTGFLRAYWRYFYQNWSKEDAFAEWRSGGHIIPNALDDYLEKKFSTKD